MRRLWHTVVPLAIPLLAVQGMAADSFSLWDHFATKPAVAQAAMQVVAIAKADQDLISEWQGDLAHSAKPPPDRTETERLRREIDGLEIGISEMEGELKAMSPDADPERLDFQRRMRLEIEEKIRDYSIRARDLKVQLRELQSPQRDQSR